MPSNIERMHASALPILLVSMQAAPSPATPSPPRPVTSFDCSVEHSTPNGQAEVFWRLLPDGSVIEHTGSWSSTYRPQTVRLSVLWRGTSTEPLGPNSLASITPAAQPTFRSGDRSRVRLELRVPGALGNVHWFAFATPYGPWNEVVGRGMINWGELLAMMRGTERLEVRVVDPRGRVIQDSVLDAALVEEARQAATTAQGLMIGLARDFRTRCRPYDGDPDNRDIVL